MTIEDLEKVLKLMDRYRVTNLTLGDTTISKQFTVPQPTRQPKEKPKDPSEELLALIQGKDEEV